MAAPGVMPTSRGSAGDWRGWLRAYRVPLSLFLLSRLWCYGIAIVGLWLLPLFRIDLLVWPRNPETKQAEIAQTPLPLQGWLWWDAQWYRWIAEEGYSEEATPLGERNTAFFPAYPLLVRATRQVVPNTYLAGLLVSNVALGAALLSLYRFAQRRWDEGVARRSVALLAFSPFGLFLSGVYTESLFLLAALSAFEAGEQRHWGRAALWAAVAGATRVVGFLLVPALLVLAWNQRAGEAGALRRAWLLLPLGLLGPLAFMAFLAVRFGDPLAFVTSQYAGWGESLGVGLAVATMRALLGQGEVESGYHLAMYLFQMSLVPLYGGLALMAWRRMGPAYGLWSLATLGASLSLWRSIGRFALVVFPLTLMAALLLRNPRHYRLALALSIVGFTMLLFLYTHGFWVA